MTNLFSLLGSAERPSSTSAERPSSTSAERPSSTSAERPSSASAERPSSTSAERLGLRSDGDAVGEPAEDVDVEHHLVAVPQPRVLRLPETGGQLQDATAAARPGADDVARYQHRPA